MKTRDADRAGPISPIGGNGLSPEEAEAALRSAMVIIESVGTTGIYDKGELARDWMRAYFPSYAEKGDW